MASFVDSRMGSEAEVGTEATHANVVERIRWRAQRHGTKTAFTFLDGDGGKTPLSWQELDRRARAFAASLEASGATGQRAL